MKKFILIMFILAIISLQFPFYSVMGVEPVMDIRVIKTIFTAGISGNNIGNALVYLLPVIGIIFSVIGIFIKKNLSLFTALVSVAALFYCGFIYFAVTGADGGVKIGFIINIISYIMALTVSVVSLRMKDKLPTR